MKTMETKTKFTLTPLLTLLFTLTLALLLYPHPTHAASITLDLDNLDYTNSSGYTVDTADNSIRINGTDPVTIKGDGTNGGDGWEIVTYSTEIYIESGTTLLAPSTYSALMLGNDARLVGLGDNITITAPARTAIDGYRTVTIDGTIDTISSGDMYGIRAANNIEIAGTVNAISSATLQAIRSEVGNITISGTVGTIVGASNISSGNPMSAIAARFIIISGTVGSVSGYMRDYSGIVVRGDSLTLYGGASLTNQNQDLTIENGQTLTIHADASLYIGGPPPVDWNVTLTNYGTIINEGYISVMHGTITNHGTVINNGTIANYGTINGDISGEAVQGVVLDLDDIFFYSGWYAGYTLGDTPNTLVINSTSPVTIKGNGTNNGNGWHIELTNATEVFIEPNTTLKGRANGNALYFPKSATITGLGENITIDGSVTSAKNLTIDGTIDTISNSNGSAIYTSDNVYILGTINKIISENGVGIYAYSDVIISGTVDSVSSSTLDGIFALNNISITGTVGTITAVHGITAHDSISITGTVGTITANVCGILATNDISITGTVDTVNGDIVGIATRNGSVAIKDDTVLYTSSIMKDATGDLIPIQPSAASQGILFIGDKGTVYGEVTLQNDLTIESGSTLTIPQNMSLTVPSGIALTNHGTIYNYGILSGDIIGNGVIIGVTLDLDDIDHTGDSGYNITDGGRVIYITSTSPVTIKGDGTSNGDGWAIIMRNATEINIEGNTTLYNSYYIFSALHLQGEGEQGVSINGLGGNITIDGGPSFAIASVDTLTINGTIDTISGDSGGINSGHGVEITGTINRIVSKNRRGIFTNKGRTTITGTVGYIFGGIDGISTQNVDYVVLGNNALAYTSSLDPDTTVLDSSQGILFVGGHGTVYGEVTLQNDLTIESGSTLTIPAGASLAVPSGITLTNHGSITNRGSIAGEGGITNNSQIDCYTGNISSAIAGNRAQLVDVVIVWPTDLTAEAGQALADIDLTNGIAPFGAFVWQTPTDLAEDGIDGEARHIMNLAWANSENYDTIQSMIDIDIVESGNDNGEDNNGEDNNGEDNNEDNNNGGDIPKGGGGGAFGFVSPNAPVIPIVPSTDYSPEISFSTETPSGAAIDSPTGLVFTDISVNDWFYNAVVFVTDLGLFHGYGGGIFAPHDSMTRAMFVTVLHNLEGRPAPSGTARFTDVAVTAWEHDSVQWAAEQGIVSGIGGDLFAPSRIINRQEMASILSHYADYKGIELPTLRDITTFTDIEEIDDWAKMSVVRLVQAGVINGDNNAIMPKKEATRAEVAQVFMNFMRVVGDLRK